MTAIDPFFRWTELDRTTFPEWRERILEAGAGEGEGEQPVRSYPGYPRWPLPRSRPRLWPALDRVLLQRRCARRLGTALPTADVLGRLLHFSHGVTGEGQRGPVPSAGSLQGLELYLVVFESAWLPAGLYHYGRAGHVLAQIAPAAPRAAWLTFVPALGLVEGGAVLWIVVGDAQRVQAKYGERGLRFLLLEAGHLMQNLCLLSASLGLSTVPLGGYLEQEIAGAFALPAGDRVLDVGVVGTSG